MSKILIDKAGNRSGAASDGELHRAIAQNFARIAIAGTTDLTDSSTGTASSARRIVDVADGVEIAADGSNLAQKAATETALGKVKGALATLFTKSNEIAGKLGIAQVTYNGGGTDGAGTVAAMDLVTTGATTGAQDTEWNANVLDINDAFFTLASQVNKIAVAAGYDHLQIDVQGTYKSTVPAISGTVGTAAAPGISKAAVDAALAAWAANTATIAARINAIAGTYTQPTIIAVP